LLDAITERAQTLGLSSDWRPSLALRARPCRFAWTGKTHSPCSGSKKSFSENPGARLVHNWCTTYTIPGRQPGGTVATGRLGITGKIRVVAPGSCQAWAVENVN